MRQPNATTTSGYNSRSAAASFAEDLAYLRCQVVELEWFLQQWSGVTEFFLAPGLKASFGVAGHVYDLHVWASGSESPRPPVRACPALRCQ